MIWPFKRKSEPPVFDWFTIEQDVRNAEANERRRAIATTRAADLRARYQSRPRQKKVIA